MFQPWIRTALCGGLLGLTGCGGIVDQDAARRFRSDLGRTTVTVLPVFVRTGTAREYDPAEAAALARFFETEKLATASVAGEGPSIAGGWRVNEARMLRESASDVGRFVTGRPPETAYVVYAEYLLDARGQVGGVHMTVHDRQGRVVYARLINSHAKVFKDLKPSGRADCLAMLTRALQEDLRRSG